MKTLVLLLSLLLAATESPREILYGIRGNPTSEQSTQIRSELVAGWTEFHKITSGRVRRARFVGTTNLSTAKVVFDLDKVHDSGWQWSAASHNLSEYGAGQITVYYKYFSALSKENRPRIMAHEWSHIVFRLPDEYGGIEPSPTCVMGNFLTYGYSGHYCDSCQQKVDEIYGGR